MNKPYNPIRFTKMHGLGNDFMVIDAINQPIKAEALDISALAKRTTGIGFDQCLLVEKSPDPYIDFFYRIFNADGQEVGQCGNGARCLALFVKHYGLTKKNKLCIATKTTQMTLTLNSNETVTVDFGQPCFAPEDIPLNVQEQLPVYTLSLGNGELINFHALSVGNPHAIIIVNDLNKVSLTQQGKAISEHPLFPEQTNVGFMQIVSTNQISLRVYERGCGETQACGSGAVAAAVVAQLYNGLISPIEVSLPGGDLMISWDKSSGSVLLTGPATFVYEGTLCGL